MAEAREGQTFIKHEFEEAITIQESIVEAERELAKDHPLPDARKEIDAMASQDEEQLRRLREEGGKYGAKGERDPVSQQLEQLARDVSKSARRGPDSEKYEAHAVLLAMKRKQQDSARAMIQIARGMGNRDLRVASIEMFDETRDSAEALAASLGKLATELAMRGQKPQQRQQGQAGR